MVTSYVSGRYGGIYDANRKLLGKITNYSLEISVNTSDVPAYMTGSTYYEADTPYQQGLTTEDTAHFPLDNTLLDYPHFWSEKYITNTSWQGSVSGYFYFDDDTANLQDKVLGSMVGSGATLTYGHTDGFVTPLILRFYTRYIEDNGTYNDDKSDYFTGWAIATRANFTDDVQGTMKLDMDFTGTGKLSRKKVVTI